MFSFGNYYIFSYYCKKLNLSSKSVPNKRMFSLLLIRGLGFILNKKRGIHTVAVRRLSDKKFEVYNYDLEIKKSSYIKSIGELYTGDWKQYSCIYGFN